jgi:hypothetical protein
MTNKHMLLIATILMLVSINNVTAAQAVNTNITNDWPDSRYTVHGNGTVTDTVTGLMWRQCSVGQSGNDCSVGSATKHTWQAALQLAGTDATAGYRDWRLPNKNELSSIVALDRYDPSINAFVFPNTSITRYWTSTAGRGSDRFGWLVSFVYGAEVGNLPRYWEGRVRLVRSAQ